MSNAQKLSLYYAVTALDDFEFNIVYKMVRGLNPDVPEVEELSPEEAALYAEDVKDMERGEYITFDEYFKKRQNRSQNTEDRSEKTEDRAT
ncbi:MAG: hypothetical protein LBM87_00910 [Ruminococcus sp.]|jgi:hypothetical protein|nr:hypothetical protein [Ruminococcus sp.]